MFGIELRYLSFRSEHDNAQCIHYLGEYTKKEEVTPPPANIRS